MTIPVPVPVSQFPSATLPLEGDELVPIVKDGVTSKVPSSAFGVFSGKLAPEGAVTLPAGTYDNVDFDEVAHLLVTTSGGDVVITGFIAPMTNPAGTPLLITNLGPDLLTLNSEDAGSDAANQMLGVSDITIPPGGSQLMYYTFLNAKFVLV